MKDESAICDVDDVIITGDLDLRPSRAPDHDAESRALTALAEVMGSDPGTVLQRLVETTIKLTRADSAGISLLEPGGEQGTFRWVATAGAWAPYCHGAMPREQSPCGEVIAREAVLLVTEPERAFPALLQAEPGIGEGLLAPFHIDGVPGGAVWAVMHGAERHFEAEDLRLLKSLARFASAAHQTVLSVEADRRADQARADAALRESEERYRAFVMASADAVYRMSPDWSEMRQLEGQAFLLDTAEPSHSWLDRYIHPDDQAEVHAAIEQAIRTRSTFDLEHRVIRADGSLGWTRSRAVPILTEAGDITEWLGAASDVTAAKETAIAHAQAETALRDSEARFRQFSDASTNVLWIRDAASLRMIFVSPAFETIYGRTCKGADGFDTLRCWAKMIVPEDRKRVLGNIRRVRAGERVEQEFRIRRACDGALRWIHNADFPMRDGDGRIRWVGGLGMDITDAKEAAERQGVLVAELQHRTRNLIGVVRSLCARTIDSASSLQDFERRFGQRLAALSRVQGRLSHLAAGDKVAFDELLRAELAAHGATEDMAHKLTLEGPTGVPLRSGTVQLFALALHELATNAGKYGALAAPEGHLTVRWHVDSATDRDAPRLHVEWRERGVVMPEFDAPSGPRGYGRDLIEQALPYQFKAKTSYELGPDGVLCTIVIPIAAGARSWT